MLSERNGFLPVSTAGSLRCSVDASTAAWTPAAEASTATHASRIQILLACSCSNRFTAERRTVEELSGRQS